jgi:hypothetical protein
MDDFHNQRWHLSKRFQVADMITMLMLAVAFAIFLIDIESKTETNGANIVSVDQRAMNQIAALEAKTDVEIRNLKERDIEIRREMNRHQDQVIGMLKDIQTKMDRHQEAHLNNP